MRYDRQYGPWRGGQRASRGRDVDYGWGVPVRGMYDYSLDYGGLSGPESEESESIPGYETGPDDWTGPRPRQPRYESHHWAAAEPAGESRYRGEERGRGGYGREFGSFRSAFEAARQRARSGYEREYGRDFGPRGGGWGHDREEGRSGNWGSMSGGSGREQPDLSGRGRLRGGRRGGSYDTEFSGRPHGRGSSFGPGRGFGGGQPGGAMRGWSGMPGMRRGGREPDFSGMAGSGDEGLRARSGAGYGRQLPEERGGFRSGWRGSGMRSGESRGGRGRGKGRGFGWPRQGAPYDPEREDAMRESRGPRGRWGPYGGRVAPGGD